jgi:DNA invertase Pin-like site-specific DNA recombinase
LELDRLERSDLLCYDRAHDGYARSFTVTAMPKVLGYIRVSSTEQIKGFGLEVQEDAIKAYCKANRVRLVDVLRDEGISGSNGLESRVGLAEALVRLKAGEASALVVYRMDRLARDLILQETLVERLRNEGTPVRSASEPDLDTNTDDPTKILIRQIVGAVSQYERAVIRGRLQSGKKLKHQKGGFIGGRPPYGYQVINANLVPDPEEAITVGLVKTLHADGRSLREISVELERRDIHPRKGATWQPTTLKRILDAA